MVKIAPSILASDFSQLADQARRVEAAGADWLHLDVMDGHFVPNISFGPPVIRSLRPHCSLPFDVHLMIEQPDRYLEEFREAGADRMTVHVEACTHLNRTVMRIKELGAAAGVSVNPATPVAHLRDILPYVDLILIMSVNPGFGGQRFIESSVEKIRETAAMLRDHNSPAYLEVDGGIDDVTTPRVVTAGANVLVAGSYVFEGNDIPDRIKTLRTKSSV